MTFSANEAAKERREKVEVYPYYAENLGEKKDPLKDEQADIPTDVSASCIPNLFTYSNKAVNAILGAHRTPKVGVFLKFTNLAYDSNKT